MKKTKSEKGEISKRCKICVLTGTRAEYGLLRSLLRAVEANPKLELQLLVTGTHLLKEFGNSRDLIRRDGFKIAASLPMYKNAKDLRGELPGSLGRLVANTGRWLADHHSDWIVVLGDRVEALGGALAGLTANVPIAHLHGGELAAGDMDDRIRFAISSLATAHFVSTTDSQNRLLRAGEPKERIHVVGAMAMDEILQTRRSFLDNPNLKKEFRARFDLPLDRPMFIVLHHPCGFGAEREYQIMKNIFRAVKAGNGIVIGPNNDPGHSGSRRAIGEFFAARPGRWHYCENLAREDFLLALWSADFLVGNSSSGILEANALQTAVINIGPRQAGRQRNGNAVFDCLDCVPEIRAAFDRATPIVRSHKIRSNPRFGKGTAGESIARVLAALKSDRNLLVKAHQ
jgi:UDP-hydrolysing UDP-N-acetyl-D-glucosamine 2-epimerase